MQNNSLLRTIELRRVNGRRSRALGIAMKTKNISAAICSIKRPLLSYILAYTAFAYGNVVARWNSPNIVYYYLIGIVVYIYAMVRIWKLSKHYYSLFRVNILRVACFFAVICLSSISLRYSGWLGRNIRDKEISVAIAMGLESDGIFMIENWPVDHRRIFPSHPEWNIIPDSIKSLNPVYVTISREEDVDSIHPPNIGICMNGFAGFAAGLRVYATVEAAQQSVNTYMGKHTVVTETVYVWFHPT
jgi:hypothetical protein